MSKGRVAALIEGRFAAFLFSRLNTLNQDDIVDKRKEDPWNNKQMLLYFAVTMMIFFCCADMDTIFSSYLYIYGMCSETYDYDPVKANNIVTVYWIAFAVGRLSGIFLTPYISSWLYILVDCILSLVAITVMIGLDYLMPLDVTESAKDASIIISVIIFAIFVSVCSESLIRTHTV